MMDIQFGRLANLQWLWVVAAMAMLLIGAAVARRRAWRRFATPDRIPHLAPPASSAGPLRALLPLAAAALMVLALVDVRWGRSWREVPQTGIEVMFVLDVSRSMLAEDASPNRLSRAKSQINDMVDEMAGDRVGLVVFAGQAHRPIPLTSHYDEFRQTLQQASPSSVLRGGSRLGDALQLAADSFLEKTADHKAIVVFTDGESHEGDPVSVAQQLREEEGIRVFTVGLGDMQQGARIPLHSPSGQRTFLEHDGQQVWSKLDAAALRQIALASGGAFIPAGTKRVDMGQVYHGYIANVQQQQFETARIRTYIPRYQWFVGAALACLLADSFWPLRRRRRGMERSWSGNASHGAQPPVRQSRVAAAVALLTGGLLGSAAVAAGPPTAAEWGRQAGAAMQQQDFARAAELYEQAMGAAPDRYEPVYNAGVAYYRHGNLQQAAERFSQALATPDGQLEARARFNLGNVEYRLALQAAESDPAAAITHLQSAIDHYRGTLSAAADQVDARANIELAQRLILQLQEQQSSPQSAAPPDPPGDGQDQPEDDAQDQPEDDAQDPASPSSPTDEQPPEAAERADPQEQQKAAQQQDQQQDQQRKPGQQQENQQQESQQDGGQQPTEGGPEQAPAADPAPTDSGLEPPAGDQPPTGGGVDAPSAMDEQAERAGDQRATTEQPSDPATAADAAADPDAGTVTTVDGQPAMPPQQNLPMTLQEAQKMLQAIRDRELLRRMELQRRTQRSHIPVDRDW